MPLELPEEIASTIPPEQLNHASVQKYNSPADLIKGHIELQQHLGRSFVMPTDKPEELEKWAGEQSVKLKDHGFAISKLTDLPPAKPEDYQIKLDGVSDETIKSDKVLGAFKTNAHKLGLNNAQANALVEHFAKEIMPALVAEQPKSPEFIEGQGVHVLMEKTFGKEATQAIEEFKGAVQALKQEIPELFDVLNEGVIQVEDGKFVALGDHPAIVKLVREVGKLKAQDFSGNVNGVSTSPDGIQAKAEADDIRFNKTNPKHDLYARGDKMTVAYVAELLKKAHPGSVQL